MRGADVVRGLVSACHLGPTATVTSIAGYLGVVQRLPARRVALLIGAVGSGQLSIGWSNDLIDAGRDRAVGRDDKAIVRGEVTPTLLAIATAGAGMATTCLSRGLGREAGIVHGVLVVGAGWAYNLGLKRTRLSILPYVVAFGALPQVSALSATPPSVAPGWRSVAGALLGVAAHCLNVLPDLTDDSLTGVRGGPHRLSEQGVRHLAVSAEVIATLVTLIGTRASGPRCVVAAAVAVPAVTVALRGTGRAPFVAVETLAALNAVLLSGRPGVS